MGVKTHPVVGPFQRKVATVIKEMKSQSVADAQMTAIELQHEIGFCCVCTSGLKTAATPAAVGTD